MEGGAVNSPSSSAPVAMVRVVVTQIRISSAGAHLLLLVLPKRVEENHGDDDGGRRGR